MYNQRDHKPDDGRIYGSVMQVPTVTLLQVHKCGFYALHISCIAGMCANFYLFFNLHLILLFHTSRKFFVDYLFV